MYCGLQSQRGEATQGFWILREFLASDIWLLRLYFLFYDVILYYDLGNPREKL